MASPADGAADAAVSPRASVDAPAPPEPAPAPPPAAPKKGGLQADEGFNAALKVWLDINLTKLRPQLDAQGLEVVEAQKENLAGRKRLAELTKDWRKGSEDEKKEGWTALLKAYQNEIDSITKRGKTAEMHFLNLYRLLAEAPDPGMLIKSVLDQSSSLTDSETLSLENQRLRADLDAQVREMASLRSQAAEGQQAASRLSRLEQTMEQQVSDRVDAAERALRIELEEKTALFREREHALQRQLAQHLAALAALQSTHDVAQRRLVEGEEERYGREVEGRWREVEMLQSEVERERARRGEVERENELLKQKLERALAVPDPQSLHHLQSLLSASEQESSRLLGELERTKQQLSQLRQQAESKEEELASRASTLAAELDGLRRKFSADGEGELERLRKEVEVLRSVEFGAEALPDVAAGEGEDAFSPLSMSVPLDKLLMRKNKRLAAENTERALQVTELSSRITKLEGQIVDLARREAEKDRLIKRLEDDLLRVDPMRAGPGSVTAGPWAVSTPTLGLPSAGIVSAAAGGPQSPPLGGPAAGPATAAASASDQQASLIRILTAQRDRYRHRNGELEELHRKDLEQLSEYRTALEGLKEDNLKLYEKVRFLQSAAADGLSTPRKPFKSTVSSASGSPSNQAAAAARSQHAPSVESKYAPMYEARLDPFSRFSRTEEMRRVNSLPPLDKATLQFTRFFLANRYTRMSFLMYAGLLHLLVTALLYRWSTFEECRHDHGKDWLREQCVNSFGAGVLTGAGGAGLGTKDPAGGLKMESGGKRFELEHKGAGFVPEAGSGHKLVKRAAALAADPKASVWDVAGEGAPSKA
ncbi:CASP C terminal-domain-containing protein [Hyaloraphidium curvatum]|nr:CASP C terminal-domain-containing protein [Hyaloraphidium curvatum]